MKKILSALCIMIVLITSFAIVHAEDTVIYESGLTETKETAKDLDGWGKEIFTECIFEADVQFKENGSGITLMSSDNTKDGTSIRAVDRNGVLTLAADGGTGDYFIYYIPIDTDAWYHIKLIGNYGVTNGMVDMVVDTYDKDKNIVETKNYYVILMNKMYASSGVGPEHIRVEANTAVDNVKVTELKPDAIKMSAPSGAVMPGSTIDISAKPYRGGNAFDYNCDIKYTIDGKGISVSEAGILTVDKDAPEQTFTVKAEYNDMSDSVQMTVASGNVFTIKTAVFDEEYKTLKELKTVKNYYYDGTAAFVITVYDENNILNGAFIKNVPSKSIPTGKESSIIIDCNLPENFNKDTYHIEIQSWSVSDSSEVIFGDDEFLPIRKVFEENNGAVEWIADRNTVIGMLNGKTAVLQIGNKTAYIEDTVINMTSEPYIIDGSTYVDNAFIAIIAE